MHGSLCIKSKSNPSLKMSAVFGNGLTGTIAFTSHLSETETSMDLGCSDPADHFVVPVDACQSSWLYTYIGTGVTVVDLQESIQNWRST